jgi:hypothetical protein
VRLGLFFIQNIRRSPFHSLSAKESDVFKVIYMPINMTFSLLLIWLLADYISYEIDVEIVVQEWEYFKDKPAKDYWDYKLL